MVNCFLKSNNRTNVAYHNYNNKNKIILIKSKIISTVVLLFLILIQIKDVEVNIKNNIKNLLINFIKLARILIHLINFD